MAPFGGVKNAETPPESRTITSRRAISLKDRGSGARKKAVQGNNLKLGQGALLKILSLLTPATAPS